MTALEKLIEELPPDLRPEVEDFARFLLTTKANRYPRKVRTKPSFRWAGAVKDLRDRYTSVDLQHEISGRKTPAEIIGASA